MLVFVETMFFHVLFLNLFDVYIPLSSKSSSCLFTFLFFTFYSFYFAPQQHFPKTTPIIIINMSPAAINPMITQTFPKIKFDDYGYSHAPTLSLYIFPFLHSQFLPSAGLNPSFICEQFS